MQHRALVTHLIAAILLLFLSACGTGAQQQPASGSPAPATLQKPQTALFTQNDVIYAVRSEGSGLYGYAVNNSNSDVQALPGSPYATPGVDSIAIDPYYRFVLVLGFQNAADATTYQLMLYRIDPESGALSLASTLSVPQMSSLQLDSTGSHAFAGTLTSIYEFQVDGSAGTLTAGPVTTPQWPAVKGSMGFIALTANPKLPVLYAYSTDEVEIDPTSVDLTGHLLSFRIDSSGALTQVPNGFEAKFPLLMGEGFSPSGNFWHVMSPQTVQTFAVHADGTLQQAGNTAQVLDTPWAVINNRDNDTFYVSLETGCPVVETLHFDSSANASPATKFPVAQCASMEPYNLVSATAHHLVGFNFPTGGTPLKLMWVYTLDPATGDLQSVKAVELP